MPFTVPHVSAVLLVTVLSMPAAPAAAQHPTNTERQDFRMFLHTISLRRNARVCGRGMPEFRKRFEDLYAKWSQKHRAEVARGESIFRDALKAKDLKAYPYTSRAALKQTEEALDELSQPLPSSGPITPEAHTVNGCERLLTFLRTD
jgi:hypothetical protein